MSLLRLHLLGSPVLRERSAPVAEVDAEVRQLVDDLFETMVAAEGIGLAANQVGIARRVAVVAVEGTRVAMINPVIAESSGSESAEEGCLSIPEVYGQVTRPGHIVLEALDREGAPVRVEADGLLARAIQHEIDHLDGVLFVDHLSLIKRKMLLSRYRKEHRQDSSYIKELVPASERRA